MFCSIIKTAASLRHMFTTTLLANILRCVCYKNRTKW